MAAEHARREAHRLPGMVAVGEDPVADRARSRRMPLLGQAFEQYMMANPKRKASTKANYRDRFERPLADWLGRSLEAITRSDVEDRFNRITEKHGWATANQCISLLRSVYRRPCVDHEGLTNPVDLWLAGGGRFHPKPRRKIRPPAEVLPCWRRGVEAVVSNPALRDVFWFGMYTGMRLGEVMPLTCAQREHLALAGLGGRPTARAFQRNSLMRCVSNRTDPRGGALDDRLRRYAGLRGRDV